MHVHKQPVMPLFNCVLIRGFHSDIHYYPPSPPSSSADLLKVLVIACDVAREDVSEFVRQLAEGRDGLSLVYMYHADALKSGTSYQNSSHIHLRDNCEVRCKCTLQNICSVTEDVSGGVMVLS